MKKLISTFVGVVILTLATSQTVAAPAHKYPSYEPASPTFQQVKIVEPRKVDSLPPESARVEPASTPAPKPVPVKAPSFSYSASVSWYGPGFYCVHPTKDGCIQSNETVWLNKTACGQLYTKDIIGVAHRTLPCGTKVIFEWKGKKIETTVIDRGPYVAGRIWDLSGGLCKALNHCFTGPIYYKVIK